MTLEAKNTWEIFIVDKLKQHDPDKFAEILDLKTIKDFFFSRELYFKIKTQIEQGDLTIKDEDEEPRTGFREYLSVISFSTSDRNKYFACIYDSDELWQDPEIIETFLVK